MTGSIDRILDVVDAGLQRSSEVGADGGNPSKCWRCKVMDPAEGSSSGLCAPCRSFLLEEGPDPLRADGLIAYIDAELFQALQTRLFEGDRTGVPVGISPEEFARLRAVVETVVETMRDLVARIVDAFLAIDWNAILRHLDEIDDLRRDHRARRTLPPGARGRGRPTAPPRDLRATEGPRSLPRPRRKTP